MVRLQEEHTSIFQATERIAQKWQLRPLREQSGLLTYRLQSGENCLGSDPSCQCILPVAGVAAVHARLFCENGRVRLEASDSRTWINDGAARKGHLKAGDRLTLGPVTLCLEELGEPQRRTDAEPQSDFPLFNSRVARYLQTAVRDGNLDADLVDFFPEPEITPPAPAQTDGILDELQKSLRQTQQMLHRQQAELQQLPPVPLIPVPPVDSPATTSAGAHQASPDQESLIAKAAAAPPLDVAPAEPAVTAAAEPRSAGLSLPTQQELTKLRRIKSRWGQRYQQQREQLQHENFLLQQRASVIDRQSARAEQALQQQLAKMAELESERQLRDDQLRGLSARAEELQSLLETATASEEETLLHIRSLEEQLAQLETSEQAASEYRLQVEAREQAERVRHEQETAALREELARLQSRREQLEAEFSQQQDELEKLTHTLNTQQELVAQQNRERESLELQHQEAIEQHRQSIEQHRETVEQLEQNQNALQTERDRLTRERDELAQEKIVLQAEVERQTVEIEEYQQAFQANAAELEQQREAVRTLTEQLDQRSLELEQVTASVQELEAACDQLLTEQEQLRSTSEQLTSELDSVRAERERLQAQLQESEAQAAARAAAQAEAAAAEISQLRAAVEMAQAAKVAEDLAVRDDLSAAIDEEWEKLSAERDRVLQLKQDLLTERAAFSQALEDLQEVRQQAEQEQYQLREKEEEISAEQLRLELQRQDLDQLRQELERQQAALASQMSLVNIEVPSTESANSSEPTTPTESSDAINSAEQPAESTAVSPEPEDEYLALTDATVELSAADHATEFDFESLKAVFQQKPQEVDHNAAEPVGIEAGSEFVDEIQNESSTTTDESTTNNITDISNTDIDYIDINDAGIGDTDTYDTKTVDRPVQEAEKDDAADDELGKLRHELAAMFGISPSGKSASHKKSMFDTMPAPAEDDAGGDIEAHEAGAVQPQQPGETIKSLLDEELFGGEEPESQIAAATPAEVEDRTASTSNIHNKLHSDTSEHVVDDIEDADSVTAYMERLFARTNGRQDYQELKVQSRKPSAPESGGTRQETGRAAVADPPAGAVRMIPVTPAQPDLTRSQQRIQVDRETMKKEIEQLRDVANQTARNALATHAWKQVKLKMMASGVLTFVSGVTAVFLICSPYWSPISYQNYGWLTLFLTVLSAGELFRARLTLIKMKQLRKASPATEAPQAPPAATLLNLQAAAEPPAAPPAE